MKAQILRYNEFREIGKELNTKLFRELSGTDIRIAARILGVLKKNALVLGSEGEMDRFSDFAINDYRGRDGDNSVRRYLERSGKDMGSTEAMLLRSLLVAKASLYAITGVRRDAATVRLSDLLSEEDDIEIIDKGFSSSPTITDFLIYTRVVKLDGVNMSSGAPMLFRQEDKDLLLTKCKAMLRKVSAGNEQARLSAVFFKLNKRYGHQQVAYV